MWKVIIFLVLFIGYLFYSAVVYSYGTDTAVINASYEALKGKELWQKNNCIACHQLYGLGGYLGSELTTVMSQPGKGEAWVKAIIKTGNASMPAFKMTDSELRSISAYLAYIDSSAVTYR